MNERFAIQPLDSFNGGSANGYNGKFNLQIPTGPTFKEIVLKLGNLAVDQVTRVRLTLNGDAIVDVSGSLLQMMRKYTNQHFATDRLIIPFGDFTQNTQQAQDQSDLVTLPGENLVLHVETGAPTAAQTTANNVASLDVYAMMSASRSNGRLRLPRIFEDVISGGRSGENRYNNFVNQNKSGNPVRIKRMHILTDRCDQLELRRNGLSIFKLEKPDNNFLVQSFGMAPQDDIYHYDPVSTGFSATDALNAAGRFEFIANLVTPGDFTALFETVEIVKA